MQGHDFLPWCCGGDTHLHTSASMDAGAFGNRLGLRDAYRYARGEEVASSSGVPARLSRPYDWLVVADHSDNMGMFPDLLAGEPHILADPTGKDWYNRIRAGDGVGVALELIGRFSQGDFPEALTYGPETKMYKEAWADVIDAAEEFNDPGKFTALIGFEWTSLIKGANNMHRVVIYRDGAEKASQMVAYTTTPPLGSPDPMDLWRWLTVLRGQDRRRRARHRPQRQPLERHHVPALRPVERARSSTRST